MIFSPDYYDPNIQFFIFVLLIQICASVKPNIPEPFFFLINVFCLKGVQILSFNYLFIEVLKHLKCIHRFTQCRKYRQFILFDLKKKSCRKFIHRYSLKWFSFLYLDVTLPFALHCNCSTLSSIHFDLRLSWPLSPKLLPVTLLLSELWRNWLSFL